MASDIYNFFFAGRQNSRLTVPVVGVTISTSVPYIYNWPYVYSTPTWAKFDLQHFPKSNSPEGLRLSRIRCYVSSATSGDRYPVTL